MCSGPHTQGRPVNPLPTYAWEVALAKLETHVKQQLSPGGGGSDALRLPSIDNWKHVDGASRKTAAASGVERKRIAGRSSWQGSAERSRRPKPSFPRISEPLLTAVGGQGQALSPRSPRGSDSGGAESDDTDILIGVRVSEVGHGIGAALIWEYMME